MEKEDTHDIDVSINHVNGQAYLKLLQTENFQEYGNIK